MAKLDEMNPFGFASMQGLGQQADPVDTLLKTIDAFSGIMSRDKAEIGTSLNGLNNLIGASMTDEQIANAEMAVLNLDKKSSRYGETDLQHQALAFSVQNKRHAYDDYKTAVDTTADFIDSDLYITKAEDWQDLDALYKDKTDIEGKPLYDSVADMMVQEYAKLGALQMRTKAGKEAGFYYKGAVGDAKKFEESDVFEKMLVYQNRLDKSMEALIGDGTITEEEASLIMQGIDRKGFINFRNTKIANIEGQIRVEQGLIRGLDEMILRETISEDDVDFFQNLAQQEDSNLSEGAANVLANVSQGNREEAIKAIKDMRDKATIGFNQHLVNYKNWSGTDYADLHLTGGKSLEEFASGDELGETLYIDPQGDTEETGDTFEGIAEKRQQTYEEKYNLPADPTEKAVDEPKSTGEQFMYDAVNKNIPKEQWDSTIEGMDDWDAHWVGPVKSMFGAGKTSREIKYFVKDMYGKKLLSLDEWKGMTKGEKTGAGYPKEYKNYVNMYNSVSNFMDEYLNPSQQNVSTLDSFLTGNAAPKTLFHKADHITSSQKLRRKYLSFADRIKFNKLRKLYRQSGLSLEEFKEKYNSEYLNGTRRLKYSHSVVQSHYKIPKFYGKLASN